MKVLLIKQSSLGDLVHCFPAISELKRHARHIQLDWLVEEGFVQVPRWHNGVNEVLPIAVRRWRKNIWKSSDEISTFVRTMRARSYDIIIDAQALLKSALIAKIIRKNTSGKKARIIGLDKGSIRTEKLCTVFYDEKISVPLNKHAIWRVRQLFAKILGYDCHIASHQPLFPPEDFSFPHEKSVALAQFSPYIVGVHATTWASKHIPVSLWHEYVRKLAEQGKKLLLPWYGEAELEHAKRIQFASTDNVIILPRLNLNQIASVIRTAEGVIAVDSGYAHIAAAMGVPTVTLYGATNKKLTAALGERSTNLQSQFQCSPCLRHQCQYRDTHSDGNHGTSSHHPPCYADFSADKVWQQVRLRKNK